jgi:Kdo2-lipid IVA lauroyltransferase/acyltransferase
MAAGLRPAVPAYGVVTEKPAKQHPPIVSPRQPQYGEHPTEVGGVAHRIFESQRDSVQLSEIVVLVVVDIRHIDVADRRLDRFESHWTLRLRSIIARGLQAVLGRFGESALKLIRKLGLDRAARLGSVLMRSVGPWLGAHRVARVNLKAAFPDKSDAEIDRLLQGVWDNFGRVMAEYAFLDQLYDYDPLKPHKWIVIDPADIARCHDVRTKAEPVLGFGAHLANWELPALASIAHGVDFAGIYRPHDSAALENLMARLRGGFIKLLPAQFGIAVHIRNALVNGTCVAMMVDQYFADGVDVLFFGRPCKVNPLLARLARKYEYPIRGSWAVRLPDGRLRLAITEPLKLPRDAQGKVDVAATMQLITWVVEGWVREHPEQWLWLHRRWR